MASDRDFTRRMLQTVAAVAGVAILVALLWAARDALLLVYVSALIAMGLSPLVKLIEKPARHGTKQRVPRWLAILAIYAVVVAIVVFVGLLVIPPLVAQGASLWAKLPSEFNRLQAFLVSHRLMVHPVTLEEAVRRTTLWAERQRHALAMMLNSSGRGRAWGATPWVTDSLTTA